MMEQEDTSKDDGGRNVANSCVTLSYMWWDQSREERICDDQQSGTEEEQEFTKNDCLAVAPSMMVDPVWFEEEHAGDTGSTIPSTIGQPRSSTTQFETNDTLRAFIAPPDPISAYTTVLQRQQEPTCEWLLQREEYKNWKAGIDRTRLPWLHGKPGCGKTTLCSAVIENLSKEKHARVYYYFSYGAGELEQSHESTLRALLWPDVTDLQQHDQFIRGIAGWPSQVKRYKILMVEKPDHLWLHGQPGSDKLVLCSRAEACLRYQALTRMSCVSSHGTSTMDVFGGLLAWPVLQSSLQHYSTDGMSCDHRIDCQLRVAIASLGYVKAYTKSRHRTSTTKDLNIFPSLLDAVRTWVTMAHHLNVADDEDLMILTDREMRTAWLHTLQPDKPWILPFDGEDEIVHASPLYYASYIGWHSAVVSLLQRNVDLNEHHGYYGTALMAATHTGNTNIVRILLEGGADVAQGNAEYGQALHIACLNGHEGIVQDLIAAGANVDAVGGIYGCALQAAACKNHTKILRLLLGEGADVSRYAGHYGTALRAALENDSLAAADILLDHGADINARWFEDSGNTALHSACRENDIEMARWLIQRGATVHLSNSSGITAWDLARCSESSELMVLLLQAMTKSEGPKGYRKSCESPQEPITLQCTGAYSRRLRVSTTIVSIKKVYTLSCRG